MKTLDEMLELEPGEDVGDLVHGGALLLHLHPGGEQATAHRLVPLFLAAQLHLIAIKGQCHNPCFGFGENVTLIINTSWQGFGSGSASGSALI